jgi:hypothetical protein
VVKVCYTHWRSLYTIVLPTNRLRRISPGSPSAAGGMRPWSFEASLAEPTERSWRKHAAAHPPFSIVSLLFCQVHSHFL